MTRGETQEVPREEASEQPDEIREQDREAQRELENAAEGEPFVEATRPPVESEAIEAAVVEAVVAAEAAVGRPGTEAREEITPAGEEGTATPISLPTDPPGEIKREGSIEITPSAELDEEPPKPPQGRMEGEATRTEDRDPSASLDEASFKVESQAGEVAQILDETSFKFTPAPPEDAAGEAGGGDLEEAVLDETAFKVESQAEVQDGVLDEASFKFFSPQPDQEIRDGSAEARDGGIALQDQETGEILGPDAFKPIPAAEGEDELSHEDHWSVEDGAEAETGQEEEGSSILIGEEGEEAILGETLADPEAASAGQSAEGQEVEEYWEPPEMYVYIAPDGSKILVDGDGNPVKCPPQHLVSDKEGGGDLQGWYDGSGTPKAFDIPPWPGYGQDPYYIKMTEQGTEIVDADGNPVDKMEGLPKGYLDQDNPGYGTGDKYYKGPDGSWILIKPYDPVKNSILLYTAPDGTKTFVHSDGNPLKCPPKLVGDPEKGYGVVGPDGKLLQVDDYKPPTEGIYVYTAADGSKTVVDKNGDPLTSPPAVYGNPEDGYFTPGAEGGKIQVSEYVPPIQDIYLYRSQDGSVTYVDQDGNPLKYPPQVMGDPEGGFYTMVDPSKAMQQELSPEEQAKKDALPPEEMDSELVKIPIKDYVPPVQDVYMYIAQDGTKTIVDASGDPVNCPPHFMTAGDGGFFTKDAEGKKVDLEEYKPPLTDIYVYTAPDGSKTVVDKYGNMVKSPPHIWNDPAEEGKVITVGPDGKPLQLNEYKPLSSHWD